MHDIIEYCKNNWLFLSMLPGNLLMVDSIVRAAAEAHGYKKTASICDKIANFLSFIVDIISGLLAKKQAKTGA